MSNIHLQTARREVRRWAEADCTATVEISLVSLYNTDYNPELWSTNVQQLSLAGALNSRWPSAHLFTYFPSNTVFPLHTVRPQNLSLLICFVIGISDDYLNIWLKRVSGNIYIYSLAAVAEVVCHQLDKFIQNTCHVTSKFSWQHLFECLFLLQLA